MGLVNINQHNCSFWKLQYFLTAVYIDYIVEKLTFHASQYMQ